jgi:26S proteasome non-ATPase regulatory subunit 10
MKIKNRSNRGLLFILQVFVLFSVADCKEEVKNVSAGADHEECCLCELHMAASKGNISKVKLILKNEPHRVNEKNVYGYTPLSYAVSHGQVQMLNLLISQGANVTMKSIWDETALHSAARMGNMELCKILIENGADINAADDEGRTPLHVAAYANRKDTCSFLIEKGADVNARDKESRTVLRYAVYEDLLELLKKHGAVER